MLRARSLLMPRQPVGAHAPPPSHSLSPLRGPAGSRTPAYLPQPPRHTGADYLSQAHPTVGLREGVLLPLAREKGPPFLSWRRGRHGEFTLGLQGSFQSSTDQEA